MAAQVLEARKDAVILGTLESAAFILSLRSGDEFSEVHSSGYHRVPHIGVYGADYRPVSPLVLLSLPARRKCLERLPFEVLNALDLSEVVYHKPGHAHQPHPQQELYRNIAKELVKLALLSAVRRVYGTVLTDTASGNPHYPDGLSVSAMMVTEPPERWRSGKRDSAVSMESCPSSDCCSLEAQYDSSNGRPTLPAAEEEEEEEEEEGQRMFGNFVECPSDSELRMIAKKLVRKAIHVACNRVESLNRRSSIEYLIANTKRMKIEEERPSTLFEEEGCGDEDTAPEVTAAAAAVEDPSQRTPRQSERLRARHNRRRGSPTPRGKKRERSKSHEASMNKEIEKFRQVRFGEKIRSFITANLVPRLIKRATRTVNANTLSPPAARGNVNSLISNLDRLSIAEGEEAEEEGEYTVLSAITKGPLSSPPRLPSPQIDVHLGSSVRVMSTNDEVPTMDYFIVVHTRPTPGECQKFNCSNTNEVNVMYHCWLFSHAPYDHAHTVSGRVEVGLFEPSGVNPVHLDLHDSGIPFQYLEPRTVCIHSCCFSPENIQLQLSPAHQLHSFFTAGRCGSRRVVTFHVIPGSGTLEQNLRTSIAQCTRLGELLATLTAITPTVGDRISQLVLPATDF